MQAVDVMDAARRLACAVGGGTKDLVSRVNPDVWRELACVGVNAYTLFLPRRERIDSRPADGHLPIVLVHGLGANRGTWTPLRLFLRLHGRKRMYAFGYEDGTVERIAKDLEEFVDRVLETTGATRIDVVCHSMGGVVSRYAIQRLGLAERVRTLVTLASPHRGTYVANWANTTLTNALRADSELIADLNADDFSKLPIRFVAVSSDRDVYVLPHENQTHPDAENVFVPGLAHTEHLLSPAVWRVVLKTLKTEEAWSAPCAASPSGGRTTTGAGRSGAPGSRCSSTR
jgi:pimeloyl-ACP methyl ester carboxylesterase